MRRFFEFVGQVRAPCRPFECHLLEIVRVWQVIDTGNHRGANILRFGTIPPTEMPPKPTP
jgi:hypothetical protein